MIEYSQGVCQDGSAILKDGQPMTIEEILNALRMAGELNCSRSHPHEEMGDVCLLRTKLAKTENTLANLRSELHMIRRDGCLPDGDGVMLPVIAWADEWVTKLTPNARLQPTTERSEGGRLEGVVMQQPREVEDDR